MVLAPSCADQIGVSCANRLDYNNELKTVQVFLKKRHISFENQHFKKIQPPTELPQILRFSETPVKIDVLQQVLNLGSSQAPQIFIRAPAVTAGIQQPNQNIILQVKYL